MMKFDVAVGNPPYSDNASYRPAKPLYADFFKQSIEIADISALVLPYSPNRKPPHHYALLDEHVIDVSEDVGGYFTKADVQSGIRVFIATSKKQVTRHPALVPATFHPLPSRRRLNPLYGPNAILRGGYVDHEGDTLPCVYMVTLKGPKWKRIGTALIRGWNAYPVARTEWVILLSAMITRQGKIKTAKCRNPGYPFTSNMIAVLECEDEADADALNAWLHSPEFQEIAKDGIAKMGGRVGDFMGPQIITRLPGHR